MTEPCADLDEFFDGELAADQADTFRDHLAGCERCQRVLEGRMQESIAVRVPAARLESAAPALARASAPELAVPASGATLAARVTTPGAPVRTFGLRRALTYASPLLAAAAAIPLWLWLADRPDPDFEVALSVERAPATASRRSIAAHTGDIVWPSVRGERYRAIRVYLDEHRLVAACPEDPRCRDAGGELTLELHLAVPGKYAIVGLGSSDPLAVHGATLEQTLVAARRAGIYTQIRRLDVE